MASVAKNAILRALIEGVITDLMVKTKVDNVYVDDTTTLAAKLSEIVVSLNGKTTMTEVNTAMSTALGSYSTTEAMNTAISNEISKLINGAPGTYDTLKELAEGITNNEGVINTLNSAIGNKADKTTVQAIQATINALGSLAQKSSVSENDLDSALKEKVNAASEGNHSHSNKSLLDSYTQSNSDLEDAVSKKHSHSNKTVIDGITSTNVSAWSAKSKVYYSESQPTGLTANDLWFQIVE